MGSARRAGATLFVSASKITCSRFPVGSEVPIKLNAHRPRRPQGDGYSHLSTGGNGDGLGGKGSGGGAGGGWGGDGVFGIGARLEKRSYCTGLP
jgi:hypothetical protein